MRLIYNHKTENNAYYKAIVIEITQCTILNMILSSHVMHELKTILNRVGILVQDFLEDITTRRMRL